MSGREGCSRAVETRAFESVVVQALRSVRPRGSTALRDAVHLALELRPRDRSRPLMLVFTDGRDTASWLTEEAVLDSARRVGVVIHAVRVGSDGFPGRLATASGGRTWSATSDRRLRALFIDALEEMRALPAHLHAAWRQRSGLARAEGEIERREWRHPRAAGIFRGRADGVPPSGGPLHRRGALA